MTASIASPGLGLLPYAYSVARDPTTGKWMVRRHDRVLSRTQPDHGAACSFAWTHHALHPEAPLVTDEDNDPGAERWTDCPIRRQLRQHRHEAQERTT